MRILLVQPPWGASYKPSIGLHILQQYLKSLHGWEVDLAYLNLDFHNYLPDSFSRSLLIKHFWDNPCLFWFSEGFFAPYAYTDRELREQIIATFLSQARHTSNLPPESQPYPQDFITWLRGNLSEVEKLVRNGVPAFLSYFTNSQIVKEADLIGFGCFYNQLCSSLSMARALKERNFKTPIVLGGASITVENSAVLLKYFDHIDYVIEGEGEIPLVQLCEKIALNPQNAGFDNIPSLSFRDAGRNIITSQRHQGQERDFVSLDKLPALEYSSFFEAVERSKFQHLIRSAPYETTRGCYWKQQSKCSFCGLADNFPFRMKSPGKVFREVTNLAKSEQVDYFVCADACLPKRQMRKIIPRLVDYFKEQDQEKMFFFEVRADLTREDIALFGRLGTVVLQAGIESFSTKQLSLMQKGIDALANVRFLKWCRMENVSVFYNLLYGHPGEDPKSYKDVERTMQLIIHLDSPQSLMIIMLLRNSPLYRESKNFGIYSIHPWNEYDMLFPSLDDESRMQMAYYFHYDCYDKNGAGIRRQTKMVDFVKRWQEWDRKNLPYLYHELNQDGSISVYDNRPVFIEGTEPVTLVLRDPVLIQVLLNLDDISTVDQIEQDMLSRGYYDISQSNVIDYLKILEEYNLILKESGRYLGLSLPL